MIVTSTAVTKLVTGKTSSKTITVKLETFTLFAIASYSSGWRIIFWSILFVFLSSYFLFWNFWSFVFLFWMLFLLRILTGFLFFKYDWDLDHICLRFYPFVWLLSLIRKRLFIKSLLIKGFFIILVFVSSCWKPDETDIDINRRFL